MGADKPAVVAVCRPAGGSAAARGESPAPSVGVSPLVVPPEVIVRKRWTRPECSFHRWGPVTHTPTGRVWACLDCPTVKRDRRMEDRPEGTEVWPRTEMEQEPEEE